MKTRAQPKFTFTDQQVTAATGLHIDNLRRLITWGAVKPIQAGGGRGRVRKWTARQALRVSVTAQFVEAGFSLQMAHTLTYCLPLDDLLYVYDPEIILHRLAGKNDEGLEHQRALMSKDSADYWPDDNYLGSQTLIVDRKYLYSDVLGDSPTLFAIIDLDRQRVYPDSSPYRFKYGAGMAEVYGLPPEVDARRINRASLLIDRAFFGKGSKSQFEQFMAMKGQLITTQVISVGHLVCRNFTVINLALGLTACVRQLLGLPITYHPLETRYDDGR